MRLRIGLAVKQYHPGNPAEYLCSAFHELAQEAQILSESGLYQAQKDFDYFICVDSGEALNLSALDEQTFSKLAFWFIDYRHNKHRPGRTPTDFETAKLLQKKGAWIFQSQREDFEECQLLGLSRCSYLPLAADPRVWSDSPLEQKQAQLCFVGHVWDEGRLLVLQSLAKQPCKVLLALQGKLWKQDAARLLRSAEIGFNVNSFFGSSFAYDVNMRVFETLSCGVPLLTNYVPALSSLFGSSANFIRCYSDPSELTSTIKNCLSDANFLNSGAEARRFILSAHTYKHRASTMLEQLASTA